MTDGAVLFARYAYPPNALGYCGPDDARAVLEHAGQGVGGADLVSLARQFEGAWPYLQLIAACSRIEDPLDERVVRAYWLGGGPSDHVDPGLLVRQLDDRFRRRVGPGGEHLRAAVAAGGRPDHAFHVLAVSPWVGLLRGAGAAASMVVLDRCRVRWGRVLATDGRTAVVEGRPLTWDGTRLGLGAPRAETAVVAEDGYSLAGPVAPGDWVSLHWDWVCERLPPAAVAALARRTRQALARTVSDSPISDG